MSDKERKTRKHYTVRPYFTTPLIYWIISMLAVIPLCFIMLNVSVNLVHKAQGHFKATVADYTVSDEGFAPSNTESGSVSVQRPAGFSKVGEITCESAGLHTSAYYGSNRASFREGAGVSTEFGLPGFGKKIEVCSNATGGFTALENVKEGDEITFVTSWGKYKYKVYDASVRNGLPKEKGETLYLITAENKNAFSVYGDKKLVVSASLVSGPKAEEVQNEQ